MRKSVESPRPKPTRASPRLSGKPPKRSAPERFPARDLAKRAKGDPLPGFVEPCLATLKPEVPAGDKWVHEVKWDGYRLMVRIEDGDVRILTRRGHDWTDRFPAIRDAAKALPVRSAMIDGEAVVEVEGVSNFSALQAALGAREGPGHKAAHEAVLYAFDLLHLNGVNDLMAAPLLKRKAALAEVVGGLTGALRYSEHLASEQGAALYRHACAMGLEGIISKRRDCPYRSGRRDDWLKIKCTQRQEFVVAGYLDRSDTPRAVGALVLGVYTGKVLTYVGRVGTGFTSKTAHELWKQLQPLRADTQPFPARLANLARKGVVWVRPELVAEVEYRGWTSDGLVRHAGYKGLREDKDPREVVQEDVPEPVPKAKSRALTKSSKAQPPHFRPENIQTLYPDAVVPSDEGLVTYWRAVGREALTHLGRRPLKLVRHVRGKTFMHQGPLPPIPDAVHQLRIEKATGEEGQRVWVDSVEGLVGLVAMDVVEVHPWGATVDDIEHPDVLVIDIDPGDGVEWEFVTETALKLRDAFKCEGISSWPKLSGSKGVHVMAPVTPDLDWERARTYCKGIAERVVATAPRLYTTSARQNRSGRIFLDYLRNVPSIAAIGTYSPRAKPRFPVAMRVTWREVENGIAPDAFTLERLIAERRRKRSRS
jgi:bifunctional non-homologous end joining protein LigD